jgi:hypothetical protein
MFQTSIFQHDPEGARIAADVAIEQVAQGAGAKWIDEAKAIAREFVGINGPHSFITAEIRAYAMAKGFETEGDPRVWGAVTRQLEREGVIVRVGIANPRHAHGAPLSVWQSSVYAELN